MGPNLKRLEGGGGGKQLARRAKSTDERGGILEPNRKSRDVPQEASKPSLKPLKKTARISVLFIFFLCKYKLHILALH